MHIHKLGSRFLRVVTRDRRIHYFSTPGLWSLRLFWIFRNFSNIDARVLNSHQLRVIQRICNTNEIPRGSVDFERLIGTVELSTTFSQASAPATQGATPAMASPLSAQSGEPATGVQPLRVPSMVVSLAAVGACLLVAVTIFAKASVRHQISAATSRSLKSMAAMLPRAPRESSAQTMPEQSAPDATLVKVALSARDQNAAPNSPFDASLIGTADPSEMRPATLRVASLNELSAAPARSIEPARSAMPEPDRALAASDARPVPHKRGVIAPPATVADVLPPSGPPRSHPVPEDFPEVLKDTKVILRAIVSADGRVSRVHVLEGNPQLAREAARAVTFWRYSPRAGSGDAESRILFQFAPDVTTVSFLDSGAPRIAR